MYIDVKNTYPLILRGDKVCEVRAAHQVYPVLGKEVAPIRVNHKGDGVFELLWESKRVARRDVARLRANRRVSIETPCYKIPRYVGLNSERYFGIQILILTDAVQVLESVF